MAAPLKIFLVLLGIITATIAGAAVWVITVFDPNDYRDEIGAAVQDATGRELALKGPLELRLFPWLGAQINGVELANAEGFGPEPMLTADTIEVRVALTPLFSGEVRIGEILLDGVTLRAATRSDGSDNWSDIAEHAAKQAEADVSTDEADPGGPEAKGELPPLSIDGLRFNDIEVQYAQDAELTRIEIASLTTGRIELGELSELSLEMSADLPGDLFATLNMETDWLLNTDGPMLDLPAIRLKSILTGPQIPGGKQVIEATARLNFDGAKQRLELPALQLSVAGLVADLAASIALADAGPSGTISLKTNEFSAQKLATQLGLPMADAPGAGPTQLRLGLALGPDTLTSTELGGQLAGAPLKGSFSVRNFAKPQLRADFDLAALDLDHWIAADQGAEEKKAAKESGPESSALETPLPLDAVKDLDLQAKARIAEFRGKGIVAKDVVWTANSGPGQPFNQKLSMNAYGGQISAQNSIDARNEKPRTGLKLNLNAVGLGDLLKGTLGEPWVTGLTELNLDLDTTGNTLKAMLAAAVGQASYRLQNGAVSGFSLVDMLDAGVTKLDGGAQSNAKSEESTSFKEFAGKLLFGGGQLKSQSLNADSEILALAGNGGLNMETLSWDMTLMPELKDHPRVKSSSKLSKLIGIAVPVEVSGPLMQPKFKLDVEGALKARAKQEIDQKKEELKAKGQEKLNEKIGKELGNALGDLFKKK